MSQGRHPPPASGCPVHCTAVRQSCVADRVLSISLSVRRCRPPSLVSFSADSGLPVYRDVANLEPMKQRNLKSAPHSPTAHHSPHLHALLSLPLTSPLLHPPSPLLPSAAVRYRDICDPSWLQRDPALFLGFWGNCFNDYRDAIPHYGYSILRKWRDERFHPHTPTAIRLRAEMKRLMREKKRRRRAAKDEWWDEDELHLNRDRGVFHPPSPPPTAAAPVDAAAPPDVTMEGERVWLSSAFSVITGDEVQFAATIDQSSASLRMHTAEGQGQASRLSPSTLSPPPPTSGRTSHHPFCTLQQHTTAIRTPLTLLPPSTRERRTRWSPMLRTKTTAAGSSLPPSALSSP